MSVMQWTTDLSSGNKDRYLCVISRMMVTHHIVLADYMATRDHVQTSVDQVLMPEGLHIQL